MFSRFRPFLRHPSVARVLGPQRATRPFSSSRVKRLPESVADPANRVGLVNETSCAKYYATRLDWKDVKASNVLSDSFLEDAIKKDVRSREETSIVEYINEVSRKCNQMTRKEDTPRYGLDQFRRIWYGPRSALTEASIGAIAARCTAFLDGDNDTSAKDCIRAVADECAVFLGHPLDGKTRADLKDIRAISLASRRFMDANEELSIAKYLEEVHSRAAEFVSGVEVWPREAIRALEVAATYPDFHLFVGGKSVGKSFLLNDLYKRNINRAIYINGREAVSGSLSERLIKALPGDVKEEAMAVVAAVAKDAVSAVPLVKMNIDGTVDTLVPPPPPDASFCKILDLWIKSVEAKGLIPLLIIDEVNEVLKGGVRNEMTPDLFVTLQVLKHLTLLTKEKSYLSVIMAASEFSEPYRLRELGFNTANLDGGGVISEVEPDSMRRLLMERWGVGPNLTDALMAVNGGHVRQCRTRLKEIISYRKVTFAFPQAVEDGVVRVLADKSLAPHLVAMSKAGFSYVDRESEEAKLITSHNVGCCVGTRTLGLLLPPGTLELGAALVPPTQMIRMVIAEQLIKMDKRRRMCAGEDAHGDRLTAD